MLIQYKDEPVNAVREISHFIMGIISSTYVLCVLNVAGVGLKAGATFG
jgi:hypothetical protein